MAIVTVLTTIGHLGTAGKCPGGDRPIESRMSVRLGTVERCL